MANPNIWAPGESLVTSGTLKTEQFVATEGQTVFTLTNFSYGLGVDALYVFVSGLIQRGGGVDFTETSTSSFTLSTGVPAGTIVFAVGFTGLSSGSDQAAAAAASAAAALVSENNAAASEAAAAISESNALTAETNAEAAQAAAETAVANLPNAPTAGADKFIQVNATADGWDYLSSAQVLTEIGAAASNHTHTGVYEPADATILKDADIGVSVQGYDADTAKTDVAQTFTAVQKSTVTTDNDLTIDMSSTMDAVCTPTAGGQLTFTNVAAGQKMEILFVNDSNYAITVDTTTKVQSTLLATISATGRYILAARCLDGTNVDLTCSGALA